jgi:hypothetical protein
LDTAAEVSIYEAIGGEPALIAVVDDFAAAGVPVEIVGQIASAVTPLADEIVSRGLS